MKYFSLSTEDTGSVLFYQSRRLVTSETTAGCRLQCTDCSPVSNYDLLSRRIKHSAEQACIVIVIEKASAILMDQSMKDFHKS